MCMVKVVKKRKMYKNAILTVLAIVLLCGVQLNAATIGQWNIFYDGSLKPDQINSILLPDGSMTKMSLTSGTAAPLVSSSDGNVYHISTLGSDSASTWQNSFSIISDPNARPSSIKGYTVEARVKINSVDGDAANSACSIWFEENTLDANGVQINRYWYLFVDTDVATGKAKVGISGNTTATTVPVDLGWHTYRMTATTQGVDLYVDGRGPVMTVQYRTDINKNTWGFGDATSNDDGDWAIDYIGIYTGGAVAPEASWDGTTWDLYYDCSILPDTADSVNFYTGAKGTFTKTGTPTTAEVLGGNTFHMATNNDLANYYEMNLGTTPLKLDSETGYTTEIRARLNSTDAFVEGSCIIYVEENTIRNGDDIRYWSLSLVKDSTLNEYWVYLKGSTTAVKYKLDNNWHTYRVTSERDGAWLFVDGSPISYARVQYNRGTSKNKIGFGDFTPTADGDWEIDYIGVHSGGAVIPKKTTAITDGDWNFKYEAALLPDAAGAIVYSNGTTAVFTQVGSFTTNTVGSGVYQMSTINNNGAGYWDKYVTTSLPSNVNVMDLSSDHGYTVEWRSKVNALDDFNSTSAASLSMDEGRQYYDKVAATVNVDRSWQILLYKATLGTWEFTTVGGRSVLHGDPSTGTVTGWFAQLVGSHNGTAPVLIDNTQFHTYRVTVLDETVKLFVDGKFTTETSTGNSYIQKVRFGDPTGAIDASMDVDYLRIYAGGAIKPVESCGDSGYLPGDLNRDCTVNFKDFALFTQSWLQGNDVRSLTPVVIYTNSSNVTTVNAATKSVSPNLMNTYDVYAGVYVQPMTGEGPYGGVYSGVYDGAYLKLSGDAYSDFVDSGTLTGGFTELYWKRAKMDGKTVQITLPPLYGIATTYPQTYIEYLKFVPVSEVSDTVKKKELAVWLDPGVLPRYFAQSRGSTAITDLTASQCDYGVGYYIAQLALAGVDKIYWRVSAGGISMYHSTVREPMRALSTPGAEWFGEVTPFFEKVDVLASAIKYCHRWDIKIYPYVTMFDGSINGDDSTGIFEKDHPEYQLVTKAGKTWSETIGAGYWTESTRTSNMDKVACGILCYGYQEVVDFRMQEVNELIAYGPDGIFLDIARTHNGTYPDWPEQYGYNQKIVDDFQARYGVNILTQSFNTNDWWNLQGEYLTSFIEKVRVQTNTANMKLAVAFYPLPGNPYYEGHGRPILSKMDYDYDKWIADATVDEIVLENGHYRDGITDWLTYNKAEFEPLLSGTNVKINLCIAMNMDPANGVTAPPVTDPTEDDLTAKLVRAFSDDAANGVGLFDNLGLWFDENRRAISSPVLDPYKTGKSPSVIEDATNFLNSYSSY